MKVAILGECPLALRYFTYLTQKEVNVRFFFRDYPANSEISSFFPLEKFRKDLHALGNGVLRAYNHMWVQMGSPSPLEKLGERKKRTALPHLFRVVFKKCNPEKQTKKQNDSNYPDDDREFEHYEEFDFVLDFRSVAISALMEEGANAGPFGAPALGERALFKYLSYNLNAFKTPVSGKIAVVSKTALYLPFLHRVAPFCLREGYGIDLFTEKALSNFERDELEAISKPLQKDYKIREQEFYEKIAKWKGLESYERAKIKKPVLESPLLNIFAGELPLSFDYLTDREGIFLTSESKDGRLKTGNYSQIFIFSGDFEHASYGISPESAGHFRFFDPLEALDEKEKGSKDAMEEIWAEFRKYFSPRS